MFEARQGRAGQRIAWYLARLTPVSVCDEPFGEGTENGSIIGIVMDCCQLSVGGGVANGRRRRGVEGEGNEGRDGRGKEKEKEKEKEKKKEKEKEGGRRRKWKRRSSSTTITTLSTAGWA